MDRQMREEEIKTIKPRILMLNLSDADVERIKDTAASSGLSVGELIENFIGDLVDGTYTNGSDERNLIQDWYDRCWFGMFPEKTFLQYIITRNGGVDDFLMDVHFMNYHEECVEKRKAELEKGFEVYKGKIYTWKDDIDYKTGQPYQSKEAWESNQREFLKEDIEDARERKEKIEEAWNGFLEWTDQDPDSLNMQEEIEKLYKWKEQSEKELQVKKEPMKEVKRVCKEPILKR